MLYHLDENSALYVGGSDHAGLWQERAQELGTFVLTISVISAQTSLIAANDAFEAARAGKYGQGFAILAGEVRQLAKQSAAAAQQIAALLPAIKNGSAASSAGKIFYATIDRIREVSENIGQLSNAIAETGRQTPNIVTMKEQQEPSMQDIATSGRVLAQLAQEMNQVLRKFVI